MRTGPAMLFILLMAALTANGMAVAGVSGVVVDSRFFPLPGAEACLADEDRTGTCILTDGGGEYYLPDSDMRWVRITREGYMPVLVPAVDQVKPVMLQQFASVLVKVVHGSTGEALPAGEFWITTAGGTRTGPFPVAAGGSRIKSQIPGQVAIRVEIPGYSQEEVTWVELRPGMESSVDIPLTPVSPAR